jgi:hypothetical protein
MKFGTLIMEHTLGALLLATLCGLSCGLMLQRPLSGLVKQLGAPVPTVKVADGTPIPANEVMPQ